MLLLNKVLYISSKWKGTIIKVILLFMYWNKKIIFREIQMILGLKNGFESWIFVIFERSEEVGRSFNQKLKAFTWIIR